MEQNDKKFKKSKKKEKRESSTKYDDIDKKWYQLVSFKKNSFQTCEIKIVLSFFLVLRLQYLRGSC